MSGTEFATTNLAVAAFLTAGRHLRLLDIDVSDPQHAQFVFEDSEHRGSQLEASFLTEGALVPGAEFHRQLRVLRRMIDDRMRNATVRVAPEQTRIINSNDRGFSKHGFTQFQQ
jgi:hypothetical protein